MSEHLEPQRCTTIELVAYIPEMKAMHINNSIGGSVFAKTIAQIIQIAHSTTSSMQQQSIILSTCAL